MADNPTEHAIDVVAHEIVASGDHNDNDCWHLYPEIGEHDWHAVLARTDQIVANLRPRREAYEAAYEHLMQRAERVS